MVDISNIFGRQARAFLPLISVFCLPAGVVADPKLEEVLVSGVVHRAEAETALPVELIDDEALRRKLASSLGATLKQQIGVNYASFGPAVGQPVIRGQAAPRVMVLTNSMPSGDAANTSNDHANAVEPTIAERIEILRGPATLLYGGGAIGGVVNVIDERVPQARRPAPEGALEYRRGSNGNADTLAGRLTTDAGPFSLHFSGFDRENEEIDIPGTADIDGDGERGLIENSAAEAWQYTTGASWVFDRGFIGLAYSELDNQYGIPPGSHTRHSHEGEASSDLEESEPAVTIALEQKRVDLRSELFFDSNWSETVRLYLSQIDYQHTELEGGETGTVYDNDAWHLRVESLHSHPSGIGGAVGLQAMKKSFEVIGDEAFVPSSDSESVGVFLLENLDAQGVTYEWGARINLDQHQPDNRKSVDFTTASVSISALWAGFRTALSVSQRAPTVEELFSDGFHVANQSYEMGDPTLNEETSINLDVGYHLHTEHLDFHVDAFYNRMQDFIYQRNTGQWFVEELGGIVAECPEFEETCAAVRQWAAEDADFIGVEAELIWSVSSSTDLKLFGDSVRGQFDNGGDVPRMPPYRFGVALDWQLANANAGVRLSRAMRQENPGDNESKTSAFTELSAYADMRLGSGESEWTLFVRADNLLDEDIRNATSILREQAPEAGRNIELGLRYRF